MYAPAYDPDRRDWFIHRDGETALGLDSYESYATARDVAEELNAAVENEQ